MVETIKFSEFSDGGDLANDNTTVGLNGGANTRFNNPWTFLPPGATGDRPAPAVGMYYRLRFNTTLEVYEYYDPTTLTWAQLSGTGTGTVNPGVANDIAFYAANGQAVSPIAGAPNAVLVSNGSSVPSMSTTLPSGLSIPSATITSSTAALLSGSVVAVPVSGTDLVNKNYVDSAIGGNVNSIIGTTNQVIASSPTGDVTLSLPQDIALGSTPTFAGLTLSSIPLGVSSGGTGVSSVTTSPTASAWAGWDANSNLSASNFLEQADLITTAAGTTVLTVASRGQQIFSGTALQNITMPVVATLVNGQSYKLINNSTNALFVNSSGANAIVTMQPLTQAVLTFNGVAGTAAASWDLQYTSNTIGVQSITGTANQVIASSPTGNITLSLPQNIATTSSPTFAGLTLTNPYIAGAGGLHSFQIFTSGTALTYTRPANVSSILVELVGGGGGGGGSAGGGATFAAAGGGGSGGYARLWVPAAASSYTYTVGTAGLGGSSGANPGGTGGTTTFSASSLQATGGGGGAGSTGASAAASVFSSQGSGGVGSNGSLNCGGSPGGPGLAVLGSLSGGLGGSSFFGGGGDALTSATGAGMSALNYGSGGGGAASTTVSFAGGNGSAGLIVVWEFA